MVAVGPTRKPEQRSPWKPEQPSPWPVVMTMIGIVAAVAVLAKALLHFL